MGKSNLVISIKKMELEIPMEKEELLQFLYQLAQLMEGNKKGESFWDSVLLKGKGNKKIELEKEKIKLESLNKELQKGIEGLQRENENLQGEVNKLRKDLQEKIKRLMAVENELELVRKRNEHLQLKLNDSKSETQKLQAKLTEKEKIEKQLKLQIENKNEKISQLESTIKDKDRKIEHLSNENDKLKRGTHLLEYKLKQKEEEAKEWKEKYNYAINDRDKCQEAITKLKQEQMTCEKDKEILQQQLESFMKVNADSLSKFKNYLEKLPTDFKEMISRWLKNYPPFFQLCQMVKQFPDIWDEGKKYLIYRHPTPPQAENVKQFLGFLAKFYQQIEGAELYFPEIGRKTRNEMAEIAPTSYNKNFSDGVVKEVMLFGIKKGERIVRRAVVELKKNRI